MLMSLYSPLRSESSLEISSLRAFSFVRALAWNVCQSVRDRRQHSALVHGSRGDVYYVLVGSQMNSSHGLLVCHSRLDMILQSSHLVISDRCASGFKLLDAILQCH